ncbi:MAG: hypothetical protein K6G29_10840 [Clostridiales bacterium]|nr:hypothetical protein [Clostridiales bacterium]
MKKVPAAFLLALCLLWSGCGGGGTTPDWPETAETAESAETNEMNITEGEEDMEIAETVPDLTKMTTVDRAAYLEGKLWEEYSRAEQQDEGRIAEDAARSIAMSGVTMKYGMKVVGDPDENGLYPLYIALHGGGSDPTGEINEDQWRQMATYYLDGVKSGVYVNPRAVRDTWDCHSNPESFPIYDRLIENMILFHAVDPERVYLLGFSAGGDGVYQITPRMTDRFAAANMSAGHPNGIQLDNLYNMPIQLQVGAEDAAYNRNKVTAQYDILLEKLHDKYGGGFVHRTNIHIDRGHNFADYDDKKHEIVADVRTFFRTGKYEAVKDVTGAVAFLDQFVRDPLPDTVVWNLDVRASMRKAESFYWLSAPKTVTKGIITARADREANAIEITTDGNVSGDFSILLSARMFDFDRPVTITIDGERYEVTPEIREDVMEETLRERGDPSYIFEDRVSVSELKGN